MAAAVTRMHGRLGGQDHGWVGDANELASYFNDYECAVGVRSLHREGIPLRGRTRHRVRWTLSDGNSRAQTGIIDERSDDPADIATQQPRRRRLRRMADDDSLDFNEGLTARPRGGSHVAPNPSNYDKLAEQVPMLSASKRVYRALLHMAECGQGLYVTVLWRLYGPRKWGKHTEFGALSALAAYTDKAEEAREEMALDVSTDLDAKVETSTTTMHAIKRDEIEETFWIAAGVLIEAEASMVAAHAAKAEAESKQAKLHTMDPTGLSEERLAQVRRDLDVQDRKIGAALRRMAEAKKRIDATPKFLASLLDAFSYDGVLRARLGAMTHVDRELTADDGLTWKLRAPPAHLTMQEKSDWSDARVYFVSRVTVEADHLRRAAHEAYRDARALTSTKTDRARRPPPFERCDEEFVKHDVSGASP